MSNSVTLKLTDAITGQSAPSLNRTDVFDLGADVNRSESRIRSNKTQARFSNKKMNQR